MHLDSCSTNDCYPQMKIVQSLTWIKYRSTPQILVYFGFQLLSSKNPELFKSVWSQAG